MTVTTPLVSIIVPIYNTEQFLPQCVDSLLRQTLQDIEIILINDGSTDGSAAIADSYARLDVRVRTIHKPNGGASTARNVGLAAATGQFIGFVDSDDWVVDTMFEKLWSAAHESGADVTMCDYLKSTSEGQKAMSSDLVGGTFDRSQIEEVFFPNAIMDEQLEGPVVLSVCRCLYRRDFLCSNAISFDEHAKHGEDYLFSLSVILRTRNFIYLKNQFLYLYRTNPDSTSQTMKTDLWDNLIYLNRALEHEVQEVFANRFPGAMHHQIQLHMLYVSLFTLNLLESAGLNLRDQYKLTREIASNHRLQAALCGLKLHHYPLVTTIRIALLRRRQALGLVMLDQCYRLAKKFG